MVKKVFQIYRRDIKKIVTNWVAFVIFAGLTLLPSLYAWVNIKASWDPYGNTKGVKVGVVNLDNGAKFKGIDVEIGEAVTDSLKKNEKLGWQFYDTAEEGKNAANKGTVYATIIIPEDFSHRLTTVLDEKPVKPKLEYYVNEKINAIAPKMTDSGATTVQRLISTSFVDTVIQKAFETFNKAGIDIKDNFSTIEKYKGMLYELDESFPTLYSKIDKVSKNAKDGFVQLDSKNQDIAAIQKVLQKTVDFMNEINKALGDTSNTLNDKSPKIKEDLTSLESTLNNVSKSTSDLSEEVTKKKPELIIDLNSAVSDLDEMSDKINNVADRIQKSGIETSKDLITARDKINSTIQEYRKTLIKLITQIYSTKEELDPILTQLIQLNDNLAKQMEEYKKIVDGQFKAADGILTKMQDAYKSINDFLNNVNAKDASKMADDIIKSLKDINNSIANNPLFGNVAAINEEIINNLQKLKDENLNPEQIEQIVKDLKDLNSQLSEATGRVKSDLVVIQGNVDSTLTQAEGLFKNASKTCSKIKLDLDTNANDAIIKLGQAIKDLEELDKNLNESLTSLSSSANQDSITIAYDLRKIPPKLQKLKNNLIELKGTVQNRNDIENLLDDTSKLTSDLANSTKVLNAKLDSNIIPTLERYLKNSALFALDIKDVVTNANRELGVVKDFITKISKNGKVSVDELNDIKKSLPNVENNLHQITDKIKKLEQTTSLNEIVNVLGRDSKEEGNFISQPVELETHKLFHIPTYGAAMTPFYSTLSLWVGALILTALVSTKAMNVDFEYTPTQEFFGKFLLFGTFAVMQGFIVCMGDIFILGVEAQQPVLFVLLGMLYSLVFTMIIYSMVALFGNVGKAIGVVFMVVQLAGSGGTFPIEVTPPFFQHVYSVLPFTYAIGGMREAIAGVVYSNLLTDITVLLIYFVGFMLIGLLLKKPVNKILEKLSHKLGESGVVGH